MSDHRRTWERGPDGALRDTIAKSATSSPNRFIVCVAIRVVVLAICRVVWATFGSFPKQSLAVAVLTVLYQGALPSAPAPVVLSGNVTPTFKHIFSKIDKKHVLHFF